jgi:stearoyl-CoA desaturase (delta-9 desaturase)
MESASTLERERVDEAPDASEQPPAHGSITSRVVTASLVASPGIALGIALPLMWGNAVSLRDIVLAAILYVVTGHGIAIGFHRLFTHSSFVPNRPLKIALAATGSMALEGSVVGWVANHRRHHMYSDREGDPHSPWRYGEGPLAQLRGLAWAHVGWLFSTDTTVAKRFAPDMLDDRDIVILSRLFPVFAIGSLALPFALGWLLAGTLGGAVSALIWAGVVRMALLHHVTWSINSICHMFGTSRFRTRDRSRNFSTLAVLSFGESWHNFHHACPSSARHGALRHQIDSSASIIRLFERFGWATKVRWPSESRIAAVSVR